MPSFFQNYIRFSAVLLLFTFGINSVYAADTYDATTGRLTIPLVRAYGNVYRDVVIQIGDVVAVNGGEASDTFDSYDENCNCIFVPSALAYGNIYTNVIVKVGNVVSVGGKVSTPIPVQSTSYLNSKKLNIPSQNLPMLFRTSGHYGALAQDGAGDWGYLNSYGNVYYFFTENAYGFADFFQDGNLSMISVTTEYNPTKIRNVEEKKLGHIFFWKKNSNNKWVDSTHLLLDNNLSCLHVRKAVIADFNNDKKPDIFLACTGYDSVPFPGEKSRILLSQPNGKYLNTIIDEVNGFSHGAAAADVNHDGNVDLIIVDVSKKSGAKPIYFMMGRGDGTFSADFNRINIEDISYKPYFSVELIDIDNSGNYSIVAGGHEPYANSKGDPPYGAITKIIKSNASGFYADAINIPGVNDFAVVLDFIMDGDRLYVLRAPLEPFYFGSAIQKFNIKSMSSSLIYRNTNWIDPSAYLVWIDWIVPFGNSIVSTANQFKLNIGK